MKSLGVNTGLSPSTLMEAHGARWFVGGLGLNIAYMGGMVWLNGEDRPSLMERD
ncbi:MAG: hypothetical protein QXO32_06265 [Candidatus Bathyarchaeia archaeon]